MARTITKEDFQNAVYRAVQETYFKSIVRATGGVNIASDSWEIEFQGDDVVIINREFGHIIKFLNDGTQPHIITAEGVSVTGDSLKVPANHKKWLRFEAKGPRKSPYKKIKGNKAFEEDGYIFAKAVRHPGIKARKFMNNIMESPKVKARFDAALEKEFAKFLT